MGDWDYDSADAYNRREKRRLGNDVEKWQLIAALEGIGLIALGIVIICLLVL